MAAPSSSSQPNWAPSPSISAPPTLFSFSTTQTHPKINLTLSPPLIAMLAVVATAILILLYARYLRRLRHCCLTPTPSSFPPSDLDSPPPTFPSSSYFLSFGLDDAAITSLPLSLFPNSLVLSRDCAVCLLEFEPSDPLRTLPWCSHSFHAHCIDQWLRSHATCPLCRSAVLLPSRPLFEHRLRIPDQDSEITVASPPLIPSSDRRPRDFLLKRSYSFGFERSTEPATASPWRYRSTVAHHRGFWSKRWPSPFNGGGGGSSSASRGARVFSFRSYKKSPFQRRRSDFFEPVFGRSRAAATSRRSRSIASPSAVFFRPSSVFFSSSRMRCGDPEALLSPERLNRR